MKPAPARIQSVYTVSEPAVMPVDRVVVAIATPSVGLADLETLLKRLLPRSSPVPARRDWTTVVCFFLWQTGPQSEPVPAVGRNIPLHVAGMVGGDGG